MGRSPNQAALLYSEIISSVHFSTLYSFKHHTNNFTNCNDVSKGIDFDRGYHQTVVDVFLKLHTHAVGVYHSSRGDWQSPVVI
jgi:hypothetical protein